VDAVGLGLVLVSAALLVLFWWSARRASPKLRLISAFTRLYRAVGLSVEDGTRLLVGVGGGSLLSKGGAAGLAGLALLRAITERTSLSDRPPVAVAGDAALALLSQDTLQAGFQAVGAAEYYQPTTGRLTGMTPFSAAAGMMPILADEQVSAAALVGHFGVEAALLSDAAERANALLVGSTDDPAAQAALYASASEAPIGEEIFSAPAYLGAGPAHVASLTVQDVLRWLIIIALLSGAALRFLGLI
jgi:hypothetical protein